MQIMDVATGRDLACYCKVGQNAEIWGVDLSSGMLELAAKKVEKKGLQDRVKLRQEILKPFHSMTIASMQSQ